MNIIPWKQAELETDGNLNLPMTSLRWNMDRIFDRFVNDFWSAGATEYSGVRLDMDESDEEIYVRAEVPGVEPEELDIELKGGILSLSGEKKPESEARHVRHAERSFGRFQRDVRLPCAVDVDRVKARHKNGVVTITLTKSEAVRPKRITVKSD